MSPSSSPSRLLFLVCLLIAIGGGAALLVGLLAGSADAGETLVAGSVCEAHELRARQAESPGLQIEIPSEFDVAWPTREACLSHDAAEDDATPGPVQPIQFSHKHHAGLYQIECQYCHSGTDRSPAAGVPSVALCMGCHQQFPPSYDELEGIRTLKEHWKLQTPVEWIQIHRLPEHVQFQHVAHVRRGIACQECHGKVEEMDKVYLTPDTKWWPWLLPTQKLEMGWCIQCHRANGASQDCVTCHY